MLALGMLSRATEADPFQPDITDPVRPGTEAPTHRASATRTTKMVDSQESADAVLAQAQIDRDRARARAAVTKSSTTLAALAQAHAVLDEHDQALASAIEALALAMRPNPHLPTGLHDIASARMAVEVLRRFGTASDALKLLDEASAHLQALPLPIRLIQAELAIESGRSDYAYTLLAAENGPMVQSFLGFLLVCQNEHQKAIPHLRSALREVPDDAAAAMNLSVALWSLGSRRKALVAAGRAAHSAPGRKDASQHYLQLLLQAGETSRATSEVRRLRATGIVADAQFDLVEARCILAGDTPARALPLLTAALTKAAAEGNDRLSAEISANLAVIKYNLQRQTAEQAKATLAELLRLHPDHEAVVLNFARMVTSASDAPVLRRAAQRVEANTTPARRAFLRHQVAWLEGNNEAAAAAAVDWFEGERDNIFAVLAAIVSLGIGLERWDEAVAVAEFALTKFPGEPSVVNNAAYAFAMYGRHDEAIAMLEKCVGAEHAKAGFVLKATLGLAHLAKKDISTGMRLYREAAVAARNDSKALSLMTMYQALVVRQLGLTSPENNSIISALALPAHPVPSECQGDGDFLRLRTLCKKRRFAWPPTLP